ncbi:Clavaminate synthase-like protein [Decorospora gaudefroyi]|uniref:Clavaminate synthase-like protein n=1 Tax=Decorospora gaudefroyi TaxID=184978 RepID=A0A6A5KHA4_9PLEO|nr:Clavaminate synthase-like protein [Decorospora gaudefroyi]
MHNYVARATRRIQIRLSKKKRPFLILKATEYLDKKKRIRIPGLDAERPALFSRAFDHIPAIGKWFTNESQYRYPSELKTAYLEQYGDAIVPLELTRSSPDDNAPNATFDRFEAPLSLLLKDMTDNEPRDTRLYLAQHSLADLPEGLNADLPTPTDFLSSLHSRGDIYASSLWMGRPPTRTPLHRDPNPNLFVQLAGKKTVRMLRPAAGRVMYETVRQQIDQAGGTANMRGEEMMQGREMEALEAAVWSDEVGKGGTLGYHAELRSGDALYIPNGWWHAVRGVGKGANASVNWWFR